MFKSVNGKLLATATAVILLVAAFFVFTKEDRGRTLTVEFPSAVSIFKGSEVRVMGVKIGDVTSVVPEGDHVRVRLRYDQKYKLPKDAKAAIVMPTLVADRFIQIAPAYTGGPALSDNAVLQMDETATPVELDRIYQSLLDLTKALGPNGANKDGALNPLLTAGNKALAGNGALANQTIKDLSKAVASFGNNSGPLFASVKNMSQVTQTLSENDQFVSQFMSDLAGAADQLNGESDELKAALASLARAIVMIRGFVHNNKADVTGLVTDFNEVLASIAKERESLNTMLVVGPVGLGNLSNAYDTFSGSIGSRVNFGPYFQNFGHVLCGMASAALDAEMAKTACQVLKNFFPMEWSGEIPGAGGTPRKAAAQQQQPVVKQAPSGTFADLLGGSGKENKS
ncbi:MAG TPA: MCE family protein [Marmoricola sp.]|nr:MCE family protein [Marmoricola sp.]